MADERLNDTVEVPAIQVAADTSGKAEAEAAAASAEAAEVLEGEVLEGEVLEGTAEAADGAAGAAGMPTDAEIEAMVSAAVTAATTGLAAEAEAAKARADDAQQKLLRAHADMDNARKRMQREADEARKTAAQSLLKDVLPVVDNLDRAVEHAGNASGPLIEGVKMVVRQFLQILEKHGAKPVDAKGQAFDPHVHEAMSSIVTAEVPPGHVAQVFQRGWTLHDRLVRPALVLVAEAPPTEAAPVAAPADVIAVDGDVIAEVDADVDVGGGGHTES